MNNLCNNTIKIYEINYFIFVNFFLYFRKKLLKNDTFINLKIKKNYINK